MSFLLRKIRNLFTNTEDNANNSRSCVLVVNQQTIQDFQAFNEFPFDQFESDYGQRIYSSHIKSAISGIFWNHRNKLNLYRLEVNDTPIYEIPVNISDFRNLVELDMARNKIEDLPWPIVFLSKLEILNLANNCMRTLPPVLFRLTSLKSLNVCNNMLQTLPTDFLLLKNLEILLVSGNSELKSPSIETCSQGKDAIFESLRNRPDAKRQNVWKRCKPYYGESARISYVKPLIELCIDEIRGKEIDFMAAEHFPPVLKSYLAEQVNSSNDIRNLHKCSMCRRYFSSRAYFIDHVC